MFRLILLSAILGASAAASAEPMTLEGLYEQALRQAEDVQIVNARKAKAEERLTQANGAMLPNLSGQATYQRLDDTGTNLDPESTSAKLTLTQPLYRGGSEYAARRAARLQVDASGHLTEQ